MRAHGRRLSLIKEFYLYFKIVLFVYIISTDTTDNTQVAVRGISCEFFRTQIFPSFAG